MFRSITSTLRSQLPQDRQELEAARTSRWFGFADRARQTLAAIIAAGCDPGDAGTLLSHLQTKSEPEWSAADIDRVIAMIDSVLDVKAA